MNRLDRIMISSLCLSMISGQTLRVCPEGKPVSTFPDHAVESRQNAPSQHDRHVERRIRPDAVAERGPAIALRERNMALVPDYVRFVSRLLPMLRDARVARSSA